MLDRLIALLIELWNDFKPILFVQEYKMGVLLRGGKFIKILSPGWHLKIPFVDEYVLDYVKADTMRISEVNITTLDERTITIGCEFDLKVVDIYLALIETNEWRSNLHDICQGILSDSLEDTNWEDIRRKPIKNSIQRKIETRAQEMGVNISNFNFTDKAISRAFKLFTNAVKL